MLENPLLSATLSSERYVALNAEKNSPASDQPLNSGSISAEQPSTSRQLSAYKVDIHGQQNQSLTYSYLSASSRSSHVSTVSDVRVEEKPPLLDGAKTILKFVEHRIATETAEGASVERIEELLQQGLSGFEQGYGEALHLLGGSDNLQDVVDDAVTTLYQQVLEGFDELRSQYLGESDDIQNTERPAVESTVEPVARHTLSSGVVANTSNNVLDIFADQKVESISGILEGLSQLDAYVEYSRRESFSFELTTSDGDTVSIQAAQQQALSGDYSVGGGYVNASESAQESSHFSFSVEGELDEQEIIAIENLLSQVFELADEFYQGDIESAYQAALDLGYDQNEITRYALHLQQTETYQAAAVYQQLDPASAQPAAEARDIFDRIGGYAQNVLEVLNSSVNYKEVNQQQLISTLAQQIDHQINPDTPSPFHENLSAIEASIAVS